MGPEGKCEGDGGRDGPPSHGFTRCPEAVTAAMIVPLGTLSNSLTITTLLSVLGVCRDRFEAFGGFKVTSGAAGSG